MKGIKIKASHRSFVYRVKTVAIMSLLAASPVFSQSAFLKAGVNVSSIAGDGAKNNEPLMGYHIGVGGVRYMAKKVSLKYELNFSRQGTQLAGNAFHYYYMNFPILIDVALGQQLRFNAGPQVGIIISAEDTERSGNITANLNTLDLSFCMGLNYLITKEFFIDCRYNVGLTSVVDGPSGYASRNMVFQGGLGYFFNRMDKDQK